MRLPPRALTPEQARALIDACGNGELGKRNKALVALYYRTGLRCKEALSLRNIDVGLQDDTAVIFVSQPKGFEGRYADCREVGLDREATRLLRDWLAVRRRWPVHCDRLFITQKGHPIHTSYLRKLMPTLAKRAGIGQRVHAHGLRHTFARELYLETKDPVMVMLALGHRDLRTTTKYLRSIGATDVVPITKEREWQ